MTFQDRRGGGAVTLEPDGTIKLLMEYNIPITRESYLDLVFAGNPPKELDSEIAEELMDLGISRILPSEVDAMMNGKLLKATARGAIAGACIGIFGAFVIGLGFLEVLHKIPDFLWNVFPVVIWERFLPLEVLVVVASAVYSVPISTALSAFTRFLFAAAYSTEAS